MGATARLIRFGLGGIVGAGIGAAAAYLYAPQSGDALSGKVRGRVADAKLAGAEAKAAKEQELINRFRVRVDDPSALSTTEMAARADVAQAAQDAATSVVGR